MKTIIQNGLNLRTAFLSNDIVIHAYRAANITGSRASQVVKMASPAAGQQSDHVNEAGDAVLWSLSSANGHRRQMTFRGVPDSWIEADKLSGVGNAGQALIQDYMTYLTTAGCGLKVPDTGVLKQNIVAMANVVPGGPIQVTSAGDNGLDTGDHVNIAGIRGFPYLLGRWKIQVISPTVFQLNGSDRYNYSGGAVGTFQGIEYVLQVTNLAQFNMIAHRDTGGPFGKPRGKRAKKLLRS
jgi:hypothetical protein